MCAAVGWLSREGCGDRSVTLFSCRPIYLRSLTCTHRREHVCIPLPSNCTQESTTLCVAHPTFTSALMLARLSDDQQSLVMHLLIFSAPLHTCIHGLQFAAEMSLGCGLDAWYRNSVIVHATARSPMGPFQRKSELLPAFSHEVRLRAHAIQGLEPHNLGVSAATLDCRPPILFTKSFRQNHCHRVHDCFCSRQSHHSTKKAAARPTATFCTRLVVLVRATAQA